MRAWRLILLSLGVAFASAFATPVRTAAARTNACASRPVYAAVSGPTQVIAWRAAIGERTAVFSGVPRARTLRATSWLGPSDAGWVLVTARSRAARGRCWLQVRLPERPNGSAGWINAARVSVQPTPWRVVISTTRRTLTLFRTGKAVRTVPVVVGKPSTPTPGGLFAVLWTIPWHADRFLGSWVLDLTAHSNALQRFDGGGGTVAIHGRGGASLQNPLGSADSHGCIRLANDTISWLVDTVGPGQLPGTPVRIV